MKSSRLSRKTPLAAGKGLKRTPFARVRTGGVLPRFPVRTRPKSLQIPDDVRAAVWERDGGMCVWCGHWATDQQHRQARGRGGSTDPAINLPSNFVCLCRPCHTWTELNPTAAGVYGLKVRRPIKPSTVRVFLHARRWVYLTDSLPPAYSDLPPAIEGTTTLNTEDCGHDGAEGMPS